MPEKNFHKEIPMTGKLVTRDPATIGTDFQTLKNLRYAETHKRGIGGMTKINSSAVHSTAEIDNVYHFIKTAPNESHFIAHLTNGTVVENTTAIPGTGNFTGTVLWTDSEGAGDAYFTNAPDGQMVYCNGVDTCIWGGNEKRCSAFITSTADFTTGGTNPRDYSATVTNTKQDGDNLISIGGGVDSYVKLMLHGNGTNGSTTITDDSPTTPHTVTAKGDAQIDTSQSVFGNASILFGGMSDYLSIPDNDDFDFGYDFCLEFRLRFSVLPSDGYGMAVYGQYVNTQNYVVLYIKNIGGTYYVVMNITQSGATKYVIDHKAWSGLVTGRWYHLAVIRGWGGAGAESWAVTIDGTNLGTTTTTSSSYPNLAAAVFIGHSGGQGTQTGYPVAHSNTYVKATSKWDTTAWPYFATDPTKTLTGASTNNNWASVTGTYTNQRFQMDLGVAKIIRRIYYENYHSSGSNTDWGVRAFSFWGSNTAGIGTVTYKNDADMVTEGWTKLTTSASEFDQHVAANTADPKYITVTNTTAYRYYCLVFTTNWGSTTGMGLRRIELQECIDTTYNGWMDEIRWSDGVPRWTADFTPPTIPYEDPSPYFVIGSSRPLQGVKLYVADGSGNTTASTLAVAEWNGVSWSSVAVTDNTAVSGVSLAQTGTVTWPSTVDTASLRYMDGYLLYWYKFYLDAGGAYLYHATVDAPFQPIVDVWDGVDRAVMRFFVYWSGFQDYTKNVRENNVVTTDAATYCGFGNMPTSSYLIAGFTEKMTALNIAVLASHANSTADTAMSIAYWDGSDWASVGTIVDGTAEGGISLAKSGTVSWSHNAIGNEFTRVIAATARSGDNSIRQTAQRFNDYVVPPLYYYKISFDKKLDDDVIIYYVSGIPAPVAISSFGFPICAQGRVLLCSDQAEDKNMAICSGKHTPDIYNGDDSVSIYFGDERELTCGTELFSQFGASLFSLVLMFKENETWMMAGQDINQWSDNTFLISQNIGCPAPLTLKTINLAQDPGNGVNRSLAIWQGTNGIYISDGRAPIPIHNDIREYFDRKDPRCIKSSEIRNSTAFVDPINHEYHWIFSSGTAGTKKELVYSIIYNGWYEIDRGTGKSIRCGCVVQDTYGNPYNYAAISGGYIERLENGTDFDGNSIVHEFQTGDFPLNGSICYETMLDRLKLITVGKSTTSNSIAVTHYGDGCTTGTTLKTFSPAKSGYRIAEPYTTDKLGGYTFHSLKFSMSTNDETIGFEPLAIGTTYHIMRED